MGLAPSCSETTVSDNRTGMAKVVNPKPKPKQARKSEKRPTNDNRDWVDDLSVEPPMSQAEEALMDKLRADFEQRGKDTSRAEESTAAGERAEKPDETHLQTEVRVETEFNSKQIRKELTLMLIRNQNNNRWEEMLRNIKRFQKQRQTQKKQHTETNKQSEERGKNVTKLTQVKIEPAESNYKGKQQVQGTVKPRTRKSNNRSVKRSRW
ncbi:hypothetical protein ACLB2K_047530 [Fragaria x ananassa]